MGATGTERQIPRATIHKQILDAAAANPDAPLEALANDVSGASIDLVERVLDEYGDPSDAEASANVETAPDGQAMSEENTLPDPDEISDEQRAVLRAIDARPDATQSEVAREVGVSASTVNRRVNKIDGFDWEDRMRFADELLPDEQAETTVEGPMESGVGTGSGRPTTSDVEVAATKESNGTEPGGLDSASRVATLEQRVARLESQESATSHPDDGATPLEDTELAAKMVRACMASDEINDDEELRVIETLFAR